MPFSASFGHFLGKSTQVAFHEQFTRTTGLFQSTLIKANQDIILTGMTAHPSLQYSADSIWFSDFATQNHPQFAGAFMNCLCSLAGAGPVR